MLLRKTAAAIYAAAVIFASSDAILAGTSPKRTAYLTFSGRFALPGISLSAGTYVFERADADISNLVRVASPDRKHIYLTALTTVVARPKGTSGNRQISFAEVSRGIPPVRA